MANKIQIVKWKLIALIAFALVGSFRVGEPDAAAATNVQQILDWTADVETLNLSDQNQVIGWFVAQESFRLEEASGHPPVPVMHQLVELPAGVDVMIDIDVHQEIALNFPQPFTETVTVQPIVFEEIGIMAGTRYGRLSFYPLRPNLNDGTMSLTTHINVNLSFTPQQVREPTLPINRLSTHSTEAIIEVMERGIVQLTHADLVAAGLMLTGRNPAGWQLEHNGNAIPLHFDGDTDGSFEANERFLFYASELPSRWTNNKTFTLVFLENGTGSRMTIDPFAAGNGGTAGQLMKSVLLEEDTLYTPNCTCGLLPAGRDGDRWVWKELRKPVIEPPTISFELNDVDASKAAEISLWTIGYTDSLSENDHGLSVSINGSDLGDMIWDGKTAYTETLTISSGVLQANNTITLNLDGGADEYGGVWLDALEIRYPALSDQLTPGGQHHFMVDEGSNRSIFSQQSNAPLWGFDLTNEASPILFRQGDTQAGEIRIEKDGASPASYFFSYESDLISPSAIRLPHQVSETEGDYIVIAPDAYHASLNRLVNLREKEGWQPIVASLEGVYDQFGYGQPAPDGIYNYLFDAYHNWEVQPKVVLLVGDGTSDPKQNQPNSKETILPVFLASVDPQAGEVAADNRYAMLDGDDLLPDVAIGRLPVNSTADLTIVIDKLMAYQAPNADWRNDVAFISDDQDEAGDFTQIYSNLSSSLSSAGYRPEQILLAADEANLTEVKNDVGNLLQDGAGHVLFSGHSTVHQWAVEGIFHISNVGALDNGAKLPIVLQMTCLTGSFQMPGLDAFDEALLLQQDGGAVAVWGASGLGIALGHEELAAGYFETLLNDESATMGDAILNGKLHLITNRAEKTDLIDSFNLLGDPAMRFAPTELPSFSTYLPIIPRS